MAGRVPIQTWTRSFSDENHEKNDHDKQHQKEVFERYFSLGRSSSGRLSSYPFWAGIQRNGAVPKQPTQLMAHHEVCENAAVVHFEGEVDMAVADEFWSHLKAALDAASTNRARLLIIDLQAVDFFGSSGLNDVARCHDEGASNGVAVVLVSTSYIVARVIQATGLGEILALYPTIDDALRSLCWVKPG